MLSLKEESKNGSQRVSYLTEIEVIFALLLD